MSHYPVLRKDATFVVYIQLMHINLCTYYIKQVEMHKLLF